MFRDPEDVFREFFGGSPFDEIFNPGHNRRHMNGNAGGSRHAHHRSSHPQNVMSPFLSFSLMDDMFSPHAFGGLNSMNGGFTSLSTFSNGSHGGGGGNMKRISTSTSFVNGVLVEVVVGNESGDGEKVSKTLKKNHCSLLILKYFFFIVSFQSL